MKLTEDQQRIHDDIIKNIHQIVPKYSKYKKNERMFSIEGSAGMGKSVLTAFLVKSLSSDFKIRVSTPTHKSLGVLSEMLSKQKSFDIQKTTIHSYLKLKPKEDFNNGTLVLEIIPDSKIEKVDILFIDEASMVGKSLYKFIDDALERGYIKCIIWISDKHQLNPVLDEINPIYDMNIRKYSLTKIIRQAEGNPIIELASKFRKCIEHHIYPNNNTILNAIKEMSEKFSEIELYSSSESFMNRYFSTKYNFYDNSLISYTNNNINYLNKTIRNILIPNSENYVHGEHLVFNAAHAQNDTIVHNNNEVIEIKELSKEYSHEHGFYYWNITDTEDKSFKAVDIDDWNIFESEVKKLASAASSATDKISKRELWGRYFDLKNEFQKVSYTYACTIHKAQGSSVNEIFINLKELFYYREYIGNIDFLKLLYVAITRTKYNCVFLI